MDGDFIGLFVQIILIKIEEFDYKYVIFRITNEL